MSPLLLLRGLMLVGSVGKQPWRSKRPTCGSTKDSRGTVGSRYGWLHGCNELTGRVIPVGTERKHIMEKDVVCGMQVDPATAAGTSNFNGKTYYFCSKGCKAKFDANPAQYTK